MSESRNSSNSGATVANPEVSMDVQEANAKYLLSAERQIPKGYKQTEVGVIPEDWGITPLATVTSEIGDGIHSTPAYSSNGDYYFINGNNISNGQIVITSETKTVDLTEYRKHGRKLDVSSILLSINGTIGNVGLFNGEQIVLGKSAAYLNVSQNVGKMYVYHAIQTDIVKRQFSDGLTGSTIKNLGTFSKGRSRTNRHRRNPHRHGRRNHRAGKQTRQSPRCQARHDAATAYRQDTFGMTRTYSIAEHQHRFAAWAAATAARASKLCRFNVKQGVNILEGSGFTADFSVDHLPIPTLTDRTHRQWRNTLIDVAKAQGLDFTHGVAAKLINCYLKGRFVCGGYAVHERVQSLHPPIDSVLLKGLATRNVAGYASDWQRFDAWRWSKYSSEQYEEVIALIRQAMPSCPLWEIESYWQGHQ